MRIPFYKQYEIQQMLDTNRLAAAAMDRIRIEQEFGLSQEYRIVREQVRQIEQMRLLSQPYWLGTL